MAIAPAHRGKFIGAADSLAKILVTSGKSYLIEPGLLRSTSQNEWIKKN